MPVMAMHETGQGFWQGGDIAGTLRAEGENRPSRPSHVIGTLCVATGQAGAEIGAEIAPTLNCNHEAPYVVGALACNTGPNGHDAGNFLCNQAVDSGYVQATPAMQVRRLTPTECERLQGFTEIRKTVKITACLDPQNHSAHVDKQCHRSPINVLDVEESESLQSASVAGQNSSTSHQKQKEHAVVHVLIDLERQHLHIHSAEKLLLHASLAEVQSRFPLFIQIENIARSLAQVLDKLERKTIVGKVGLHQNINPSLGLWNGSPSVELSGQEISAFANDAEMFTTKVKDFTRSTTSQAGQSTQNYGDQLRTLCCFVTVAISSCIQDKTNWASSCELNIEITHGYTNVPHRGKPAADGNRYKALGNSWAVPCARWIGERIALVEAIHE